MIYIANPIYDIVFKYLMEDERVVKILQSPGRNRLEELLSVFDQTRKNKDNGQVMNINEADFAGDAEVMVIIHRLVAAAADAQVRQDMNVEDEFFKAIEDRDTAIMQRDKKLAERGQQLAEKDSIIIESARQMKAAGLSAEQIVAITKLTVEEINLL